MYENDMIEFNDSRFNHYLDHFDDNNFEHIASYFELDDVELKEEIEEE